MRASSALLAAGTIGALVFAIGACDDPCCRSGVDCIDGAVCYEGACALRCDDDDVCADGFACIDGRCDPDQPGDDACPWGTTPVPSNDDREPSR